MLTINPKDRSNKQKEILLDDNPRMFGYLNYIFLSLSLHFGMSSNFDGWNDGVGQR